MSEKKKRSPEQSAARKAKESAHKLLMEKLDGELKDVLNLHTAPETIVQSRERVQEIVEHALQESFGPKVGVESIGLDRLGLSVGQAPIELAVVDRDSDPQCLPSSENTLYHTLALMDALKTSGISTKAYSPPSWISSESASRPFALPEPMLVNEAMGLVLVPPDPSHSIRLSLVEDCMRQFPFSRNVLGLLYIFAARDTDAILPPLTSRILSHLTLAYYRHKYAFSTPTDASSSSPILSFYSHPSSIISPDSSVNTSFGSDAPIIMTASRPSDFTPSRKSESTTAYDLLDLLRWWDQLRWDHHVILSTSPLPLRRSFDNETNESRTWDCLQSPLILQDPIYPLNNLATLLTPISYSELRTSFRSIHKSLCAGLGVPLARKQARLLRIPSVSGVDSRSFSTTTTARDYGDHLTGSMLDLYSRSRPTRNLENARRQAIERLANILNRWYGPQYVPVLFGSSRYGVSDRQSDLDIVILDQERPHGFTPTTRDSSLPTVYKLNGLANSMKKQYGKVMVIPAKVPIIKAKDPITNLAMDININDRLGLFNTELLEHYCRLWSPLSNLIYVTKKWAKARGLNEPAGAKRGGPTFSSYCLTLMVVGFLQSHRVLPNLHAMPPSRSSSDEGAPYFWIKVTSTTRMKCWVHWNRLPVEEWHPVNNPPLGRAFYAWLHYFAYDHKYDEFAIRIAEGGIVPRHARPKKSKAAGKTPPTIASASDQDIASEPSDLPTSGGDKEATTVIEALTDDLNADELGAATREAIAAQEGDEELEESLVDGTFVRGSHLLEPENWMVHGLVVGDPFITTKNCAANVSRSSLMEFRNACKNTLEAIDDGMLLKWLLTGETYYSSFDARAEENIQKRTNAPIPAKKKGKNKPASGGSAPQARQNGTHEMVIVPKPKNGPIYESTSARTTE